jgi:AcrR family transcriptional regulator
MANSKQHHGKKSSAAGTSRTRRNPEKTRKAILDVAGKMMALDGPEGLSVSQIAQQAGVNRGTAYHHFQTREQLIAATMQHVSQRLHDEVFAHRDPEDRLAPRGLIEKLATFAIENPEFGPAWLHQMIRDKNAIENDPFWQGMVSSLKEFSQSGDAQPNIDIEVHALTVLSSLFTWPLWVDARQKTSRQRKQLAHRYTTEALRLARQGVARLGAFDEAEDSSISVAPGPKKSSAKNRVGASAKTKVKAKAATTSRSKKS